MRGTGYFGHAIPPATQGLKRHVHMADASALVVRVDLPNLAGLHRQGVFQLSDQLARTLVEADHRQKWTVRLLVEIENLLHGPHECTERSLEVGSPIGA